jgi:hypothetical protein
LVREVHVIDQLQIGFEEERLKQRRLKVAKRKEQRVYFALKAERKSLAFGNRRLIPVHCGRSIAKEKELSSRIIPANLKKFKPPSFFARDGRLESVRKNARL